MDPKFSPTAEDWNSLLEFEPHEDLDFILPSEVITEEEWFDIYNSYVREDILAELKNHEWNV